MMKSEAQRRWMWKNKPEMAKEWEGKTPKDKKLPEHIKARMPGNGQTLKKR